jgi:aspartokinase
MKIGGIVENRNLTLYRMIAVHDRPGEAGSILKFFAKKNITLQYITESSTETDSAVMAICVDADVTEKIDTYFAKHKKIVAPMEIKKTEKVSVLGIYGPHFKQKPALSALFCVVLGSAGINILGLSSSISSICSVIKDKQVEKAKKALLKTFELP